MNEEALRAVIRETIARHLGAAQAPAGAAPRAPLPPALALHASHQRFLTLSQGDGPCVVEPHSTCDQCGFCQSFGH